MQIKVGAHTFGYISVWWTLFSLFAIFDFIDMRRYLNPFQPNAIPDWVIWGLHLVFISCAVLCFRLERPRNTIAVRDETFTRAAQHAALAMFLANLPLFAWWHGGDLALHLMIHGSLILLGFASLAIVRRRRQMR